MAMATHDVTDANVMGDINVTPMVDVMLVLLIIFMVVTPAIAAGFTAQLPMGTHLQAHEVDQEKATTLGIASDGAYYLNKKPVQGCSATDRATAAGKNACDARMAVLLQQQYAKHPEDRRLFLRADRSLPYQDILDAAVLAKGAGVAMIAEVSEQPAGAKSEDLEKAEE